MKNAPGSRTLEPVPSSSPDDRPRIPLPGPDQLPRAIRTLMARCVVAFGLYSAARTRGELEAGQRHVLVSTFAHLGEEGCVFIHQVLSRSRDYDPDVVNRAIHAAPPQPVSCPRIRRHLRLDADRDGCNCVFRLDQDSYPTPLCHLDMFHRTGSVTLARRPQPPDLDGDGRKRGYLSRKAKARSFLDGSQGGDGREQRTDRGRDPRS